jgi:hypothetical protein
MTSKIWQSPEAMENLDLLSPTLPLDQQNRIFVRKHKPL